MKNLLKALERVGLVELEEPSPGQGPATDPAPEVVLRPAAPAPAPRPAAPTPRTEPRPEARVGPAATDSGPALPDGAAPTLAASEEGRPFEAIYQEQGLPASPFPAERLLKVLDGLAALDPPARRTAVQALDAADDSWAIEDSLLDAERKTRALMSFRAQVEERTRGRLAEAKALSEERERTHAEAVARIRQQIADLEGLLARESERAATDQAELQALAREAKALCARELLRIDQEIERLGRIRAMFGPAPQSSPSGSNA